jgi:SAM-dependent methyltransferase
MERSRARRRVRQGRGPGHCARDRAVARRGAGGAGTRLLDVATGPGHVAGAAAARGAVAVGVDISDEMLARARRLYPRVDFRRADAESLPFADGGFDAAVAAFLLHHVPSPARVVGELARVARRVAVAQWDVSSRDRLLGLITDAIAATGVRPPGGPWARRGSGSGPTKSCPACSRAQGLSEVKLSTVAFEQPLSGTDELWKGVLGGSVNTRAIVLAQPPATQERIRTTASTGSTCRSPFGSRRPLGGPARDNDTSPRSDRHGGPFSAVGVVRSWSVAIRSNMKRPALQSPETAQRCGLDAIASDPCAPYTQVVAGSSPAPPIEETP